MTMDFDRPATGLPQGLKPGQRVRFYFTMGKDSQPVLTRIEPAGRSATAGGMEKRP
jgi:Cu(I)/Ag(I) efflux system membrane fusion protein